MLKIIDLFAGAGGLSLGAARAGFNIAGAVELDNFAIGTHKRNFEKSPHFQLDVSSLTGRRLLELTGLKKGELAGMIGGPPCQGFSTMGKGESNDPRNDLFADFFRLVDETSPAFFVAENVVGILNPKHDETRRRAMSTLQKKYCFLPPIKIKASLYGVPTTRTRVFFIGYDPKKFRIAPDVNDFLPSPDTVAVNVAVALAGLPTRINENWLTAEAGWRKVKIAREDNSAFFSRVVNSVPVGVGDQRAIERYCERQEVSGCMGTRHTAGVIARFDALEFGEQDIVSKASRLDPNGFCPTLRAGTGSDKGSYQAVRPVHFSAPRVITVREAARLQGFPDWFVFHDTKWHSFRQIGNSVSPIIAEFILRKIYRLCQ